MSNKAELLKKIKALADRGIDGERESAQTLLARLMEQYGISETELEIFYSAFACKNNLFPSEDKAKPRDIEELSPEEKARYMKVGLMAEGMERHTLRKAIAAGETE